MDSLSTCHDCKELQTSLEKTIETKIRKLLSRVNRVTSSYRHGLPIAKKDLVELCDYQIEFEQELGFALVGSKDLVSE